MRQNPTTKTEDCHHSASRLIAMSLAVIAVLAVTATGQQRSNCKALLDELNQAQNKYNRAVDMWKQATVLVTQAEAEVSEIGKQLNKNDKQERDASAALDKAEADQKTCNSTSVNNPLTSLTIDCNAVPGRIKNAQKELADAKITNARLEADEEKWKKELEKREADAAAVHQQERQAWAALEAARAAYAQCGAFWVGTIIYTYKHQDGPKNSTNSFRGGDGSPNTSNRFSDWRDENRIEADIQAASAGDNGQIAKVTHIYSRHWHDRTKTDEAVWCRPRNAKSHWQRIQNETFKNEDEEGSNTAQGLVWISKYNGKVEISVNYPEVLTTTNEKSGNTNVGCSGAEPQQKKNPPTRGSPVSESATASGSYKIIADIDPRTPDVVTGKKIEGDLSITGETTITWDLRLIKPGKKP